MITTCGVVVGLIKLDVKLWLVLAVSILGVGLTALAVVNHARDSTESRTREFQREFTALEARRKKAAAFLLEQGGRQDDVDPVLDFFEDVGYALKRGNVTTGEVYQNFDVWIQGYWRACFDYVLAKQKEDADIWCHVFPLYEQMNKISAGAWAEKDVKEFLHGELTL